MTAKVLPRLLELRRLNEQKALDEVTVRQAAAARAEDAAQNAGEAVRRHAVISKRRERELLASISGRSLSLFELIEVQARISAMYIGGERLQAAENDARQHHSECVEALGEARKTYYQRMQARNKIELLIQRENAKGARSFAALVEEEPFLGG
jgi:hypothetical protein